MALKAHIPARLVGRGMGALLVLVVLTLLAGTAYQYLENRRDLRENPAPGQLVDVGGHRLHLWCIGAGSPLVLLEAGGGGNVLEWSRVQPEVAKTTRVCSYDRAGLGWSELGPNPRAAAQIVRELHTLLQTAQVPGPYVLTGHSAGGLFVRLYASTYPADIVGMVLVDSTHEDFHQRMPPVADASGGSPLLSLLLLNLNKLVTVVGWARVTAAPLRAPGLNPETIRLAEQVRLRTAVPFADGAESLALDESMRQVKEARRILNIPLVVVTRGRYDGLRRLPADTQERIKRAWQDMQADLVRLSPQATQVVAVNSEHYVHLEQPDVVNEAVRTVVAKVRLNATAGTKEAQLSTTVDSNVARH